MNSAEYCCVCWLFYSLFISQVCNIIGEVFLISLKIYCFKRLNAFASQQGVFISTMNVTGYASVDGYWQLPAGSVHAWAAQAPHQLQLRCHRRCMSTACGRRASWKYLLKKGRISFLPNLICCKLSNNCDQIFIIDPLYKMAELRK